METVLVVAAHPDDEALGAAGAIARHNIKGDQVHIVFMTDGVAARGSSDGADEREHAAYKAADALGGAKLYFLPCPDNKMDSVPLLDIVQKLEKITADINPDVIYTHHAHDLNIDHRMTHQAVLTAFRPQPSIKVSRIYAFETPSATEWNTPDSAHYFMPQHYVDITSVFDQKMTALRAYDDEMRAYPHARSYKAVDALATLRGTQMGLEKAEAFMVIRQIERQ